MNILKIKNGIFKILIELFVFDKKKRSIIKARWAKRHLKKYVDMAIKDISENALESGAGLKDLRGPKGIEIKPGDEIIWQYWHQGEENAPELIKRCFDSVKKFEEGDLPDGKRVIVLSYDTIKDYIKLPEIYYSMVESGKMKIAHFSDVLRLYLLAEYGGIWIDSTIFLSGKIPENVWAANFFVMQKEPMTDLQENKMSCFFIRAKRGSTNVFGILKALEYYWAENDFVLNYFMFEHISTILSGLRGLSEEWGRMPYMGAKEAGKLQTVLFDEFREDIWAEIKSKTDIHKLSYKNLNDKTGKNSYYDYIMAKGE